MNRQGSGKKRLQPILRKCLRILCRETEENHEKH
jgi:hypothetical protein